MAKNDDNNCFFEHKKNSNEKLHSINYLMHMKKNMKCLNKTEMKRNNFNYLEVNLM